MKDEAQRGEETRRQALDLTRTEMKAYVEEQRQASDMDVGCAIHCQANV